MAQIVVGTGRNGKLFSLSGRSDDGDAADAGIGAAGDRFCARRKGQCLLRHIEPRKNLQAVAATRRRRHLHVAGPRCADRCRLGHAELARIGAGRWRGSMCLRDQATPRRPTTRGAPGAARMRCRAARKSRARTRATCSGRRCSAGKQASPVLTSVSAAYVQRNLRPKVTSLTVHPAGTVFQKPYPTGDPDIAGFDDQAPDRRILSSIGESGSQLVRPWDGASISAACRPSCGVPKTPTTMSCGTRSCIAAKEKPPGSR